MKHHSVHHAKGAKVVAPVHHIHMHKKGGRAEPDLVSGNPEVIAEAEEKTVGDKDTVAESESRHRKHGGKAKKRAKGGKIVGLMTGGPVRARLDRPGRKRGGGVGSNATPLSTAHSTTSQDSGSSNPTDTYGGTPK